MDTLTPVERMKRIRDRDTTPEMRVRRLVHAMGYRYRLHRRDLPGTPDLVFPGRRKAIWVHGCFWHRHPDPGCKLARLPKSRLEFWVPKLASNRAREARLQQRAIPLFVVEMLEEFGSATRCGGAQRLTFDKAARHRLARYLGGSRGLHMIERWLDVYAVVGDDGHLVTASHRTRRFRRP